MVKFFNQKEEVIQIELTPYGKDRLSKGLFYPKYYAFYDNDILYDGTHGNITEIQNMIVTGKLYLNYFFFLIKELDHN